jgi:hypothetical protein
METSIRTKTIFYDTVSELVIQLSPSKLSKAARKMLVKVAKHGRCETNVKIAIQAGIGSVKTQSLGSGCRGYNPCPATGEKLMKLDTELETKKTKIGRCFIPALRCS